jgi:hypothetical protein
MPRLFKEMVILGLGAVAAIYLVYPSLGIFELIPDAIPVLGSLDEASATVILLNTLRYYGVDLARLYGKREEQQLQPPRDQRYIQPPPR